MNEAAQFEQIMRSKSNVIKILWLSMLVSIILYIGLVYFNYVEMHPSSSAIESETFEYLLSAAGGILALSSMMVRRVVFSEKKLLLQLRKEIRPDELAFNAKTKTINHGELRKFNALSERELKLVALTGWYAVRMLILTAMYQAITIVGFILALMTRQPSAVVPFGMVSICLCLTIYNGLNKVIEEGKLMLNDPILYRHIKTEG